MRIARYGHVFQFQQSGDRVAVKVEVPRAGRSPNSKYMLLDPREAMRAGLALVEAGARAAAARSRRRRAATSSKPRG